MALLTNLLLLLLSASLMCVVESAPATEATPVMGFSVAERDAILDRTNTCTPFLRRPDGLPMEEDMATYYGKKKCPMDRFFLAVFDTQRGHNLLDELIVQKKKDASVCHGYIALLSLIDAYQLTEDMCADRVLVSESRSFCDHRRPADSTAVVQMFAKLHYKRLEAIADLLSNLDDQQECSEVCGGVVDSALCNSFMDAAKFFSDKVPEELHRGTKRLEISPWVHKVHRGGNESLTQDTGGTATRFGHSSGNENGQKFVQDTDNKELKQGDGGTEEQGIAPSGRGGNGNRSPTAFNASHLSSLLQQNGASPEEIKLVMKLYEEKKRNQSRPSSAAPGREDEPTPASPPADKKVAPKMMEGEEGTTTDSKAEEINGQEKLQQMMKKPEEEESAKPSLGHISDPGEKGTDDHDQYEQDEPLNAVNGLGGNEFTNGYPAEEKHPSAEENPQEGHLLEEVHSPAEGHSPVEERRPAEGQHPTEEKRPSAEENPQKGHLLEEVHSPAEKHSPVEEQRLAKEQHPEEEKRPLEEQPPVQQPAPAQPPRNVVGREFEDHHGEPQQQSYGAWHFFTIFLVLAGSAVVCYVCVHNRKKIREGVSSYTSDKKRRRRVRDYQPLSTTGKM